MVCRSAVALDPVRGALPASNPLAGTGGEGGRASRDLQIHGDDMDLSFLLVVRTAEF